MATANRYYLLDLSAPGTASARLSSAMARLVAKQGVRELPDQIGHRALSKSGRIAILQAVTEDADHTWLLGQAWITYVGDFDPNNPTIAQVVRDIKASNPAEWWGLP